LSSEQHRDIDLSGLLTSKPNLSSVDYIINSIKELLLTKKVLPGDRLPPEMELAKLLSVSRGSVREAMKILSAFGIVEIKRGDGTYVSNRGGEVVFDPLLFSLILSQPDFEELKEFRMILEKDVVGLVVKNSSDADLKNLRKCYEDMLDLKNKAEGTYKEILDYDIAFHNLLGKFSKNLLMEKIYTFIMQYFNPYIAQSIKKHTNFSKESSEAHQKILEAIENRDLPAAEKAVQDSLEVWKNLIYGR
jgi:GntR family transcriptional regulator, transcriptional repressor for pyruvate dehydrogenase complex